MKLSIAFSSIVTMSSLSHAWILPSRSPASSTRLFYQPETIVPPPPQDAWDHVMTQDGTVSPFMDMYPNAKGEYQADDIDFYPPHHHYDESYIPPHNFHREEVASVFGGSMMNGDDMMPPPPSAHMSTFQEQHLQTAELPLENGAPSYGSYRMIQDEYMGDQAYDEFDHHGTAGASSPIMPDYHQNIFSNNVMFVGGGHDAGDHEMMYQPLDEVGYFAQHDGLHDDVL